MKKLARSVWLYKVWSVTDKMNVHEDEKRGRERTFLSLSSFYCVLFKTWYNFLLLASWCQVGVTQLLISLYFPSSFLRSISSLFFHKTFFSSDRFLWHSIPRLVFRIWYHLSTTDRQKPIFTKLPLNGFEIFLYCLLITTFRSGFKKFSGFRFVRVQTEKNWRSSIIEPLYPSHDL